MTKNEKLVREKHPNARLERHRTTGRQVYFLIRLGRNHAWYADGDTAAQAWNKAAEKVRDEEARAAARGRTP